MKTAVRKISAGWVRALAGFLCSVLAGCGLIELAHRTEDHAGVRRKQAASLASFPERPIRGQSISRFFEDRVGLVYERGGLMPIGRAAPLTRDGYHLTAWHVVEERDFFLSETTLLKPLPRTSGPIDRDEYFHKRTYPGRVVWKDAVTDVALVHFPCRPSKPFQLRTGALPPQKAVFSGASGLNSGVTYLTDSSAHYRDRRGNGNYATAGLITRVSRTRGCHLYRCTLVSRGGMSGGPVVDSAGWMVGILTRGEADLFRTRTVFVQPGREMVSALIAADRMARSPGRP